MRQVGNDLMRFIRTCQECGNEQTDKDPQGHPTEAYLNRKCKVCQSEGLDYGSLKPIPGAPAREYDAG